MPLNKISEDAGAKEVFGNGPGGEEECAKKPQKMDGWMNCITS